MRTSLPVTVLVAAVVTAGCSVIPGPIAAGSYDCYYTQPVLLPEPVTVEVAGSQIAWGSHTASFGAMPDQDARTGPDFGIVADVAGARFSLRHWRPPGNYGIGPAHFECWDPGARPSMRPQDGS